jgi:pentafunctional AROM polypeptide
MTKLSCIASSPLLHKRVRCASLLLWTLFMMLSPVTGFGGAKVGRSFFSRSMCRATTLTSPQMTSNIFQEYDKPIVLIGTSSDRGEMQNLAESLSGKVVNEIVVLDFNNRDYTEQTKSLYDDKHLAIYINVYDENKSNDSFFVQYSDYELCIKDESIASKEWQHLEWELTRLVARALLPPAIPGDTEQSVNTAHLTMGTHTFFLSLSFPEIQQIEPYVEQMCADVDAMEYRTDLLTCRDSRFDLIYGQQLLRRYCRPYAKRVAGLPLGGGSMLEDVMPIVYTVRTRNQAGTYPDDEDGIAAMFQLLEWGLRSGVEVLDVESAWDETKTSDLLNLAQERYSSQILGSHHVVGKQIDWEEAVSLFQQCALDGRAHGAKVVLSIEDEDKDQMAYEAALISQSLAEENGQQVIPSISLILGEIGQFSRVINFPFTPVTHESLPFKAAPGQLTANEILATRLLTKLLTSQKYCILGHNIAYSVSPEMHNAAFAAVKLPHAYARADVANVEEFIESDFFKGTAFGGASVTIPHKQAIIPYVDVLSDAAKTIGSVNTLIVGEELGEDEVKRSIYGDNTDWKGIFNPLKRILKGEGGHALILGAGGTARAAAYAAEKLGLERLYYNRTPEKAQDLADTFGGKIVTSLDQDGELAGLDVKAVISTLPAVANFELPNWMLPAKPIVFDVNYKPYSTALLQQAESAGCCVVRGSEMLWEQGVGQFELWTGRTAPYKVMKDVVLENCMPKEEAFQ